MGGEYESKNALENSRFVSDRLADRNHSLHDGSDFCGDDRGNDGLQ